MTSLPELPANGLTSMFSRLLHSTISILSVPKSSPDVTLSANPNQQLQSEFVRAIEEGMVATRSQDHTLDDLDVQDVLEQAPLSLRLKKRKSAGGEGVTPDRHAATKRRRKEARSGDGGNAASEDFTHTEKNSVEEDGGRFDDDGDESLRRVSSVSRAKVDITSTSQRNDNGNEEVRISAREEVQNSKTSRSLLQAEIKVVIPSPAILQTAKRSKKLSQKDTIDEKSLTGTVSKVELSESRGKKSPPALKATKKRFGSEDVEIPITIPEILEVKDTSDAGSESEDEAPEIVTTSAGLEKARAKAVNAAEAVARFEADQKIKRRERDKRLKTQAKSAKKHPKSHKESKPETNSSEGQKSEEKAQVSAKAPLPILLPEEILAAAEPIVRPPTLPSLMNKSMINQKHKFLDVESRPPKDVKRGNVRIRVLQEERSILPPKASQTSKALRESWLTGRQGFKGNIVVPRRKLGGGFVRN